MTLYNGTKPMHQMHYILINKPLFNKNFFIMKKILTSQKFCLPELLLRTRIYKTMWISWYDRYNYGSKMDMVMRWIW
jgi:hypothetical protein